MKRRYFLLFICFLSFGTWQVSGFPLIRKLAIDDPVFKQLQKDIETYYKAAQRDQPLPPLAIYAVRIDKETDLISLGARCNIPYEAVATLNGYGSNTFLKGGDTVLIPNMPAVFAATVAPKDLDMLILMSRSAEERSEIRVNGKSMVAFAGTRFHTVERAMFLGIFFRYPVLGGYLSSGFGSRQDPFSGHESFHNGIDLAAPLGTPVVAAREGAVAVISSNDVLGNYIVIDHKSGYETLYGHLSKTLVRLNQEVHSGMIIGEVGVTGLTTGPHLHFEVRQRGNVKDPMLLLPKGQE